MNYYGYEWDLSESRIMMDAELDPVKLGWQEGDYFRLTYRDAHKYGFPIVMAVGMGYIIKYVWTWATTEVKPVINDANTVLIALIDRIRMLDNDLIRLNQKVNTVLHLRGKTIEFERVEAEAEINKQATKKSSDDKEAAGGNG